MNLPAYNKTIAALTIAVLGWGGVVVSSEATAVTASEWLSLGVALATALGVYGVANESTDGEEGQAAIWWVILGAIVAVIALALFDRIDL